MYELKPGWFRGSSGGQAQYVGPNGYFSTTGFPEEAYLIPPPYIEDPVGAVMQREAAEAVRSDYQATTGQVVQNAGGVNTGTALRTLTLAYTPPTAPLAQAAPPNSLPPMQSAGFMGLGLTQILQILVGGFGWSAVFSGLMSLGGLLSYGRIFIYVDGFAFGSMAPETARAWYAELSANNKFRVRLRMEGADKGGQYQRYPGYQQEPGTDNKSPWDKVNPFHPGDFWERLLPWV